MGKGKINGMEEFMDQLFHKLCDEAREKKKFHITIEGKDGEKAELDTNVFFAVTGDGARIANAEGDAVDVAFGIHMLEVHAKKLRKQFKELELLLRVLDSVHGGGQE